MGSGWAGSRLLAAGGLLGSACLRGNLSNCCLDGGNKLISQIMGLKTLWKYSSILTNKLTNYLDSLQCAISLVAELESQPLKF